MFGFKTFPPWPDLGAGHLLVFSFYDPEKALTLWCCDNDEKTREQNFQDLSHKIL